MCPYTQEAEGGSAREEEQGEVRVAAETGVAAASRSKRPRTNSLLEPLEVSSLAGTSIFVPDDSVQNSDFKK